MVTGAALFKIVTGAALVAGETLAIGYVVGAIVINLAISALLGTLLAPDIPKTSIRAKGLQNVVRDNVMPRRIIYGDSLTGGPYAVLETLGNENSILNMVVVLTGHPVDDVLGVMIENQYIDISGQGGATNTASNDLGTDYWVFSGYYGSDKIGQNTVRIIKNNGWGYADNQYVTDGNSTECQNDRARATLIANDLTTSWTAPGATRDSQTGLYGTGSKLTNCAYIYLSFRYDSDIWNGYPKLKFLVRGKRLYNPYLDPNLVEFGADSSGTHDINDPDTWEWSEDWTLSVLDYLINESYGLGAKVSGALAEINWADTIQSYLDSSALITNGLPSPHTDSTPRYTTNGILETSTTPISNMESLLTSGSGALTYAQGKYSIKAGVYRLPNSETDIINEDMIVSPLTIRTHTPRSEIFNKASGVYVERNYELPVPLGTVPKFEPTDFELVDPLDSSGVNPYEVIDGEEIIKHFDFPFTTRNFEAQRLARIQLERIRRGLTISFEANMQVLKFSVGDTVYLEILSNSKYANEDFYNRLGLDSTVQNRPDSPFSIYYKQFKILDMQYTENSTIAVSLIEEAEEIYEWNAGMASIDESAIESEIIVDDPYDTVLPPSFVVVSPFNTIEEDVGTAAGTTVTTRIWWSAPQRGSTVNALDQGSISYYILEYGIVDNPSLTGAARVSTWTAAGNKVNDHSQITQGPLPLETLYKDGAVYDFRVKAVAYSGRTSTWAYYNADIGSDYDPSAAASEGARTVSLSSDYLAFTYNSGGASPSPTSATFTATPYGFGSPQYRFLIDGTEQSPGWSTTATYTYTPPANSSGMPEVVTVEAREGSSGTAEASDSQTVVSIQPGVDGSGANAYTVILSNEAHTLSTTAGGTVDYTGSGAQIRVFDGTTELTSAAEPIPSPIDGKFSVVVDTINPSASITPGSITTSGTPAVIADHSSMTEDTAVITYAINIEDTATIYKDQSLAKSIAGDDGITVYLDLQAGFAISAADGTNYTLPSNPVSQFVILEAGVDITDTSAVTYSVVGSATKNGLTISINDAIGNKGEISLSGASWTSDSETFTVRAAYGGNNYDLQYSMTKTLKGDGLIFYSTNESDTVSADFDGTGYTLPTNPVAQLTLYENGVDITDTSAVTYDVLSPDTKNGLTISVSDTIGTKGEISLSGASWTSNNETFTVRATYDSVEYFKNYSISKAIAGTAGTDGEVGWGHDLVFSATAADAIAWTEGSIWTAAGDTFSIDAGSATGISARTYIYFEEDGVTPIDTTMSTTTSAQLAVGQDKILVAVAEDTTTGSEAFFQVFGGYGGLLITGNEVVANSITANNINAGFYTGRTFTGGVFQTRKLLADLDSPLPDTPRASMSSEYQFQLQNENDDVIFSVTEISGLSQVNIVGDVTAAIDSNIFSETGIDALREAIGVNIQGTPTGGIATRSLPTTLNTSSLTDYELDVSTYQTALTTNTLKFTIQDSGFREGSTNNPYTAPTWTLQFFYSDTGAFTGEEEAVDTAITVTGTANNISDPEIPWYTNTFSLNATREVTWTPASPFAADDTIYYMIQVEKTGGDHTNPKLTALTASEAVVGDDAANSFETHTITDTDSGYTWAETGSVVAENATDTLTWVSGTNIDIDVDATNDAIRVSASSLGTIGGSIADNQVAIGASTSNNIEGSSALTFDGSNFSVTGTISATSNIFPGGQTIGNIRAVTGDFGSIQVDGADGVSGTWTGYNIGGRVVFMDNVGSSSGNRFGIYNDQNNRWNIQCNTGAVGNDEVTLFWQGNTRLETTTSGISVTGTMAATTVTGINVTSGADPGHTHSVYVTSVGAGNGMDFSDITGSGSVTMGTPSTLTDTTTNSLTATSHTHAITTTGTGAIVSQNSPTFTGTTLQNAGRFLFNDDVELTFGTGSDVDMYFDGTDMFTDLPDGADWRLRGGDANNNMIIAYDDGAVELYYNNASTLYTQLRTTDGNTSGAVLRDHNNNIRDIGFNDQIQIPQTTSNITLDDIHAGALILRTGSSTVSVTMASNTSQFPAGSMCTIINHGTGGTYTISDGAEDMYFCDGSGTMVNSAGLTLAVGGVCNIWREGDSAYYVWGVGLS